MHDQIELGWGPSELAAAALAWMPPARDTRNAALARLSAIVAP